MSKSGNLLEKAKSYLKKNDIFYTDVTLISRLGKSSKKNHVLVFSGFNLLILTRKKVTKKIAKKYEKSIFDISSISLDECKNIVILFNKNSNAFKLTFQKEDPQSFAHLIVNYVNRLLTPYEYKKITIDELSMPTNLTPRTSHSALSRLYLQLATHQIIVPKKLMQKISQHLYSHLNSFIFSKFRKMKRFFKLFFPCLSMVEWVNQIDIYSPKQVFRLMFKQMECFENIVHVKIRGTESKELQDFVEKSEDVNSLSFHDYPVDTFDFISVLIQNKVDSIGFDSALDEIGFKTFIELPSFSNLKYFRVSDFDRLDFSSNLEKFRLLNVLSLTSCKLKIGEVLEELIINQVTTLKKLDLSGNLGNGFQRYYAKNRRMVPNHPIRRPKSLVSRNRPQLQLQDLQSQNDIEMKVSLPCKLDALFVNEVEWDVDQLIFFMNLCSNSFILNLSINRILFQDSNKKITATNEKENSSENRRRHHRIHHHNTTIHNNNNNDQIIEEEEEYYDDYDDEYDDVFAMNDDLNNNNKLSTTDIFKYDIDKWDELFYNFPKQMNSIRILNWNSNKITNEFVNFLLSSTKLNMVSFCECNCSDITFIENLLKNHRIQKVNMKQIRFNEKLLYFHTFKTFLENFPQMKYLRQIDLSHNLIDDDCFKCMSESLMNSNIESIALDNSNATSYEVLSKFYHKLEKSREQPLSISFPCLDIQRLEIGKVEMVEFIQCLNNLEKPLSKRTTEFQRFMPEVFFLRLDNNFPQYWLKERNGQKFNRTQTLNTIHHQINNSNQDLNTNLDPNPNNTIKQKNPTYNDDDDDDNDDENNSKNNNNNNDNNTNNNNKTNNNNDINTKNKSINNINKSSHYAFDISGDEDENDSDSIKIPKLINSRNRIPRIAPIKKQRSVYNINTSEDESSEGDIPKSPKNKIQIKPSHNKINSINSSSSSNLNLNSRKITYNFNTDINNNNNNNRNSMRKDSKHRGKSVNDNDNNSNNNSDMSKEINYFNSNNKKNNNYNSTKSLTPKPKHRKLSIDNLDDFNNNSFMGFPQNDNNFMNFQPIYKRRWSIHEPKNWKPKVLPASPKIDNTQIFMEYSKEFNIQRLVNKLSKK